MDLTDIINLIIYGIATIITFVGALLAIIQWNKSNSYKRAELVKELIEKNREDEDIAFIIDCLDWGKALKYDGSFSFDNNYNQKVWDVELDDDIIFIKVDKTLSHFTYICYLKKKGLFKNTDIMVFEYMLRRIMDNEHFANYLYSLYHWSKKLKVNCSFEYLIQYGIKRKYLDKKYFYKYTKSGSGPYKCFLEI